MQIRIEYITFRALIICRKDVNFSANLLELVISMYYTARTKTPIDSFLWSAKCAAAVTFSCHAVNEPRVLSPI